ncbi:POT family protein [Thozetella sp. PMI_491]|nr:POT family protein [Thozetella sp. PMI_491]
MRASKRAPTFPFRVAAACPAEDLADRGHFDVGVVYDPKIHTLLDDDYEGKPTEEELHSLRRVSGKINWAAYTIAFCELAERFSYYGSSVLYTNFVRSPLPDGSTTGAGWGRNPKNQSGALGKGQKASQGISLFNQFFAYLVPLLGGWVADARLGRYKTIHIAIVISTVAHIILVAAASPGVIVHTDNSFAAFLIGLITLCFGTGFFKANIAPLLAEQNQDTRMRVETLPSGERVLVDPAITNTRIFLYFYLAINIGSCAGQISMVYVELYVGYWLAFLLPTVLFLIAPVVLFFNRKNYILMPPTGSVLSKFFKVLGYVMKGKWSLNFARMRREFTWDIARPSQVPVDQRPAWMTYDDEWIDELRRGLKACKVFLFLPIFFLAYNQMTNNLTSQASTMELNGTPNDLIQNLNPLSIIIIIPIMDSVVYPGLRKLGISFTPIKRMAVGFIFSSLSMIAATVTQVYIYRMNACGDYAGTCDTPAPINVWVQSIPYILVGISEIFTNTTSLEYAYSKAPVNMRSLVMSVNLFMSSISAALGQALTPLSDDPLLVWNYGAVSVVAALGGLWFWLAFRGLDKEEDLWNNLKKSEFQGQHQPNAVANVPESKTEEKV